MRFRKSIFSDAINRDAKMPITQMIPITYSGALNFAHLAATVLVSTTEGIIACAVISEGPATNANPKASHRNLSAVPTSAHSAVVNGFGSILFLGAPVSVITRSAKSELIARAMSHSASENYHEGFFSVNSSRGQIGGPQN